MDRRRVRGGLRRRWRVTAASMQWQAQARASFDALWLTLSCTAAPVCTARSSQASRIFPQSVSAHCRPTRSHCVAVRLCFNLGGDWRRPVADVSGDCGGRLRCGGRTAISSWTSPRMLAPQASSLQSTCCIERRLKTLHAGVLPTRKRERTWITCLMVLALQVSLGCGAIAAASTEHVQGRYFPGHAPAGGCRPRRH